MLWLPTDWINGTPLEANTRSQQDGGRVSTPASSPTATRTEVARVLAANGFTVYLAQSDAPTPAISYAVRNLNAIGGVMITASHNAPRYNGVKLKAA